MYDCIEKKRRNRAGWRGNEEKIIEQEPYVCDPITGHHIIITHAHTNQEGQGGKKFRTVISVNDRTKQETKELIERAETGTSERGIQYPVDGWDVKQNGTRGEKKRGKQGEPSSQGKRARASKAKGSKEPTDQVRPVVPVSFVSSLPTLTSRPLYCMRDGSRS
jgi:hypothetical protein